MAFESPLFTIPGLEAGADLSAKQFYCMKMSTTDKRIAICAVDGEPFLGVLQNKPDAAGVAATVMAAGVTKVEAGETLTAGDHWGTDTAGKAKKVEVTNTGADLSDFAMGVVIEGAASGELATVTIGLATLQVVAS